MGECYHFVTLSMVTELIQSKGTQTVSVILR
jgi:hypothetical protein